MKRHLEQSFGSRVLPRDEGFRNANDRANLVLECRNVCRDSDPLANLHLIHKCLIDRSRIAIKQNLALTRGNQTLKFRCPT